MDPHVCCCTAVCRKIRDGQTTCAKTARSRRIAVYALTESEVHIGIVYYRTAANQGWRCLIPGRDNPANSIGCQRIAGFIGNRSVPACRVGHRYAFLARPPQIGNGQHNMFGITARCD
ncbi:hypothetical protein D3C75_1046510 [compost metagenome]